jgi:transcriptional regulator with XRE-family HTH domain
MELENKLIGRNLAKFRKMADIKAADLAERIGLKEAAYTKYERGETNITIDLIQKVATALNVDPVKILAAAPDNFIESITDSHLSGMGNKNIEGDNIEGNVNGVDSKLIESILKQNETMIDLMKTVIDVLSKK